MFVGLHGLRVAFEFIGMAFTEIFTVIIAAVIRAVWKICSQKYPHTKMKRVNLMSKVKIYFSNRQKGTELPKGLRTNIRKCCEETLSEENIYEDAEVSVTVVDNLEIRELNREHRDKDSVTDVLSFPMGDGSEFDINPDTGCIMLGDIVISAPRAEEQAKEYGHSLMRELCFLAVHSMFHLLGYDHDVSAEEEKIMFDKQDRVLEKLGIKR